MPDPRWPIFIPSKGRWESRKTVRALAAMGVPCRVIVEEQEHAAYAAVMPASQLLVLDPAHQAAYDPCCKLEPGQGKGSGPARNQAWEIAVREGAEWHWVVDDNIGGFLNWNRNGKVWAGDGTVLRCMESFAEQFSNVAMAGPAYEFFVMRKEQRAPFVLNTRIYSCNLIRTAAPFRWRGRWNEDTDLSLRMLKAGWCTVLFNAFLQKKTATLRMKGGNMDEVYANGTKSKSMMLASLHPDVARVTWKFNRWHHEVDYSGFAHQLVRDVASSGPDAELRDVQVVQVERGTRYGQDWRGKVVDGKGKDGKT